MTHGTLAIAGTLLALTAWVARAAAPEPVVALYTTKMGAYSDPEDPVNPGLFFELVRELGARSGVAMKASDLPWSRALKMAAEDKAPVLVFPLIRTPSREKDFSWPVLALTDRLVFFGMKGAKQASRLDELRGSRIGMIRGTPFEKQLKGARFARLDVGDDAIDNAKKLQARRIDYWYVTYNTAAYTFRQIGLKPDETEVALTTSRSGVYIGANKSFPKAMAARLVKAFKEVVADGWYKALLAKYQVEDAGEG